MTSSRDIRSEKGFSLVEMMVSVSLFAIIMLVAVGALLALVDANRKARTLESVMNNLNISLDSMVRAARMGTHYNCNGSGIPGAVGADCANGDDLFSFAPYGSDSTQQNERAVYFIQGGRIYRSLNGGTNSIPITAPEISIEELTFYVIGTQPGDITQPKVVVVVKGSAGNDEKTRTTFYIQATAVQRALDI
ncbi:prepilin-type N-terminal cleavage/methylation domain-containing protein [bacterium]|nr:prepilin-type N-terminal cleavage/methylation domain-containing protein [bacterium]